MRLSGGAWHGQTAPQRKEDAVTTWLITGCSTGLGRAFARAVLGRGHNVVATARSAEAVKDLADADPDRVSRSGSM